MSLSDGVGNSIFRFLPEVTLPKKRITLKKRIIWSGLMLAIYFILAELPVYGISGNQTDYFSGLRAIMAGENGSLLTLGIGPVVTAGIIMQLLAGSDIIKFDLSSHRGKAMFQGTQKVLAIVLCFFEAAIWILGGAFGTSNSTFLVVFMILQLALGGILILLMDEVVTKWGFGSGISLFIAANVSQTLLWEALSFAKSPINPDEFIGAIPAFIKSFIAGQPVWVRGGILPDITQVFFTIVVFLIVVYAEGMRLEIPLSYGKFRGARGRYPIKFLYASNIPVILAAALFANVQLFARILNSRGITWLGTFNEFGGPKSGLIYYLTSPQSIEVLLNEPIRAVIYLVVFIGLCAMFSVLWIDLTGMGSKEVAKKLQGSGMQIPGFRRDIRILEKVLDRYIPPITLMGGIFVGLLAAFADFTGALGTGTGILLTVGIVYRLYEELAKEQVSELMPGMRQFLG
ncbi:MAG: preprotein translocase subunit SecY [Candidatus Methanofastidiosum sp.]|nr:preprotein translocase subunit SecY [Methanofastidiosum sp.]HRZ19263.1 preprotein translocase subunit SecY [Methanofastidiosum sp.]